MTPDEVRQQQTDSTVAKLFQPTEVKKSQGRPKKTETLETGSGKTVKVLDAQQQAWLSGMAAAMTSLQVKTPNDVARCSIVADAVLEEFNKRFK